MRKVIEIRCFAAIAQVRLWHDPDMPVRIANVGSSSRSRPNPDVLLTAVADPTRT